MRVKYAKKYRVQIEVEIKTEAPINAKDIREHMYLFPGVDFIFPGVDFIHRFNAKNDASTSIPAKWGKFDIRLKEVK